jgi:hypothetical protein
MMGDSSEYPAARWVRLDGVAAVVGVGFLMAVATYYARTLYSGLPSDTFPSPIPVSALGSAGCFGWWLAVAAISGVAIARLVAAQIGGAAGSARLAWIVGSFFIAPPFWAALGGDGLSLIALTGLCLWFSSLGPADRGNQASSLIGLAVAVAVMPLLYPISIRRVRTKKDLAPMVTGAAAIVLSWVLARHVTPDFRWFGLGSAQLAHQNLSLMTTIEWLLRSTHRDERELWAYTGAVGFGVWALWRCLAEEVEGPGRVIILFGVALLVMPGSTLDRGVVLLVPLALWMSPLSPRGYLRTRAAGWLVALAIAWKDFPLGGGVWLGAAGDSLILATAVGVAASSARFWESLRAHLEGVQQIARSLRSASAGIALISGVGVVALARIDKDWTVDGRIFVSSQGPARFALLGLTLFVHVWALRRLLQRHRPTVDGAPP